MLLTLCGCLVWVEGNPNRVVNPDDEERDGKGKHVTG
jgi:hypothetical protein